MTDRLSDPEASSAGSSDSIAFAAVEERLMRIEEKLALTEDLVDTLNRTVAQQQQAIEALARELVRWRRRVDELTETGTGHAAPGPADEIPPHY